MKINANLCFNVDKKKTFPSIILNIFFIFNSFSLQLE